MHHAQFEIGDKATLRQVGKTNQSCPWSYRGPRVAQLTDNVGFAVEEAPNVPPHRNVGGLEEAGHPL